MKFATWCSVALVLTGSISALGQTTPTPAAQPTPAPTQDAPAPPEAASDVSEIEIVEPATAPDERRTIRVVGKDGAYFVDDSGETQELSIVMDRSLEFNPEIRAIRAEIEALVARLKQLEMKTATDVARKGVEIRRLKEKREKDRELVEKKLKRPEELMELDAEIAARDIEFKYLVGSNSPKTTLRVTQDRPRGMEFLDGSDIVALAPAFPGSTEPRPGLETAPADIREALNGEKFDLDFKEMALEDVVRLLGEKYGLNAVLDPVVRSMGITANLKKVTLAQALSAMADAQGLAFIVRDYGVFVTTQDRALNVAGPSIPEGLPYREGGLMGRRGVFAPEQAERVLNYAEKPVAPKTPKAAEAPKAATPAP